MAESITITDNRTGESIEIPIVERRRRRRPVVEAPPGRLVLRSVVLAPPPRASSSITELDGEAGILRYRGYPIEQLAEQSTYLEVAYLLIHGELPTAEQYEAWKHDITYHTFIHENVRKRFMEGFHHDAHPMGMLVSTLAALSTFYPEAKDIEDADIRYKQIIRLIAKMPTHRRRRPPPLASGMPFVYPDNSLDFAAELPVDDVEDRRAPLRAPTRCSPGPSTCCSSCTPTTSRTARPPPCGSSARRHADPYSATAAAAAALYGPRHGGANEAVHPDAHRDRHRSTTSRPSSPT